MTPPPLSKAPGHSPYAQAVLFNVADAIHNVLLPHVSGSAQTRGQECVTILARLAQLIAHEAQPVEAVQAPADRAQWSTLVAADLATFTETEAAVDSFCGRIATHRLAGDRAFDGDRFQAFLRSHELGGSSVIVTECIPLAGGRSKLTTLVTLAGARALPTQLVVRQDWASAVTGTSVISEFALLGSVWGAGIKVPEPLLLESSSAPLGSPFMLVTRLAGSGKGDIFNPPPSAQIALQLAAQIGKLHALSIDEFERLHVPIEAYEPEQLKQGIVQFKALTARLADPVASIDIALSWLHDNYHRVSGVKVLVHNDLGCHNFLIADDDLIAILDWEIAHIGNPAADLGYIRGWVEKMLPWNDFMTAYHAAGGPRVSSITLDFYTLWSGVRLYCLLLQARAGIEIGAVRDTEITYACAHFIPQLLKRLTEQLKAIIGPTVACTPEIPR